jgi:hypothetical protein
MKARGKDDPGLPGDWRITDTEYSIEDLAEMFLDSFIRIGKRGDGRFRIGLVWGDIRGKLVKDGGGERFEFGWEKHDEDGYACGNGWAKAGAKGVLRGEIRDASGDWVKFRAKRVNARGRGRR